MTQPSQYQLPPPNPNAPMVTRVVSSGLFPEPSPKGSKGELLMPPVPRAEEPLTWVVSQSHPLDDNIKIVRMFRVVEGVEVYSVGYDNGIRSFLPMHQVRFIEEAMPIDLFIEELTAAENGDDGPDDPSEPVDPAAPDDEGNPFDPTRGDHQNNPALA